VNRTRKSSHRGRTGKLQHGEKVRNDALERFAVAFDGQVPVQLNFLSGMRTIQEHMNQIGIDCQGLFVTIFRRL
jgi:hypothetical protein